MTAGTDYPATLFVVFEGDTRVDPLHARKMCALLQASTAGPRPILIRREIGVGHAGRAISRDVDLAADELAFLTAQLGLAAAPDPAATAARSRAELGAPSRCQAARAGRVQPIASARALAYAAGTNVGPPGVSTSRRRRVHPDPGTAACSAVSTGASRHCSWSLSRVSATSDSSTSPTHSNGLCASMPSSSR